MQLACKTYSTACTNLQPYLHIKDPKGVFDTAIDKQTFSLSGHMENNYKTWTSEEKKKLQVTNYKTVVMAGLEVIKKYYQERLSRNTI